MEFPFSIFGCADLGDFGRDHCNEVTATLFSLNNELKEVECLAQSLCIETKTLIKNNFSAIMARILPYLVASHLGSSENGPIIKLSQSKVSVFNLLF